MTQKNHQEQKATDKYVDLLVSSLDRATKNNGVFLNPDRRVAPTLFPRGKNTNGFNSLLLGLHADENGYKTGVYTLFSEAKKANTSIRQQQHGLPIMFTRWESYSNVKNPAVTISKDEYKAMSPEDQALYKPKPTRDMRVLFNIDQTTMPSVMKEDYEALLKEKGSLEKREDLPVDDKANRMKVNQFITNMKTNLVGVLRDSTGLAHYDSAKDKILLPAQNRFENFEDYVQELFRQVVSSTGHYERLARPGVEVPNGKALEQDNTHRERFVVELASAVKMQEMGMTAKLSPESMELVPKWTKAMKDDPCYLDTIAVDVNSALDVIAKAERGEKVEYASVRNEQQTAELSEAIGQKGKVAIANVTMMKDDNNRWTIFIKPEGKEGFNLYPEREDINRFFTTLKNGSEESINTLRAELAQKYYAMGTNNPQLKVDLFGRDTPQEDIDRITKANIFRNKDGQFMIMPTIEGEGKQQARELTSNQWQRLWLSEDINKYKAILAVNIYQNVLHPELAQDQTKAEPITLQVPEWSIPYLMNGDVEGLSDNEKQIVDKFVEEHFPNGFAADVNIDNRNEMNLSPAFGTRNENALTRKGESPYEAVTTVEMTFLPIVEKKQEAEVKQEETKAKEQEPKQKEEKQTPPPSLMQQFNDLKKKHPDALLLFRVGDFYETYQHDAEKAAQILGITLTKSTSMRGAEGKSMAMAGFPYHALDTYLPKLVRAGERVAICEMLEQRQTITEELSNKQENSQEQAEKQSRGVHR